MTPDINLLAVLIAAIASMIIGSIWYGPLFGKTFMEGVGMDKWSAAEKEAAMKGMWKMYLQQFVCSLVLAYVFAHVLWAMSLGAENYKAEMPVMSAIVTGTIGGFWMWLGFILPVKYGESLWSNKKFKYLSIDLVYWLIVLIAMGMILSAWAK
jgi:hypothetical protein